MLRKMFFYALGFVLLSAAAHSQTSELPDTVWTKFTYPNKINAVKFTPDGKYLASGGDDGIPRLWNAETGELVYEYPNQNYIINDIDILNNLIAIASPVDGGVFVYNLFDNNLRYKLEPSTNVVFSSDGFYLATTRGKSVYSSGISVYNSENGNLIRVIDFENSGSFDIRISSDNKFIARSSTWWSNGTDEDKYGKVEIYSFPDLNYITTLEKREYLSCENLDFNQSDEYLAGAISSSPNKIWKTDDWKLFRETGNDGYSITYSPDNKYIVIGEGGFKNWHVNIWDYNGSKLVYSYKFNYLWKDTEIPKSISCSSDLKYIAVGCTDGIVMLNAKWNTTSIQDVLQILEPEIFPNPTNNTANIRFNLLKANNVRVDIYNNNSKFITNVLDTFLERGIQSVTWQARVPAGIYFARITAGNDTSSIKIIVNK